jgi:hypothetical protein
MTTTAMTRGDAAVIVAATCLALLRNQSGMRSAFVQVFIDHLNDKASSCGGRFGFLDWHS